MKLINGLDFFRKCSGKHHWNIAAFHSPHSLTWSWILGFSLFQDGETRVWPLWWIYRTNQGLMWGFRLPFIGMIRWQRQRPMWYRDLYMNARDREDGLKREVRKATEIVDRLGRPTLVHSTHDTLH